MKITIEHAGETTVVELGEADMIALLDSVVDPVEWVTRGPLVEKVANAKARMDRRYRDVLDADPAVANIPANLDERILMIAARPDYKTRKERDEDDFL